MVSVIVPVYNVEKYLSRCIESILNQSYWDLELILVDDGSTDNCGAICDKYAIKDSRVIVVHKENGGVSAARNIALDIACGEYISFCDSDDYWDETYLEKLVSAAINNEADIIVANYRTIDENECEYYQSKREEETDIVMALQEKWNYIVRGIWGKRHGWEVWDRLFRASMISKNNIRFCTVCDNYAEDLGFVLSTLLYANKICSIATGGYNYFLRSDSIMRTYGNNVRFSSKNELSAYFSSIYYKVFTTAEYRRMYPILHFLLMEQEYNKIVGTPQYCKLYQEINKIQNREWFILQTKGIFKCYRQLKYYFGKHIAYQILLLSHYGIHGNWRIFKIESAILYKLFIKK